MPGFMILLVLLLYVFGYDMPVDYFVTGTDIWLLIEVIDFLVLLTTFLDTHYWML